MALATPISKRALERYVVKGSNEWRARKAVGFGDVRVVDPESTDIGVNYVQADRSLIHQNCCTQVSSMTLAGTFGKWDLASFLRNRAEAVGRRSTVSEGEVDREKDTYVLTPYGFKMPLDDILGAEASPQAQLPTTIAESVAWTCGLTREIAFKDVIFTASNWSGSMVGGSTDIADDFNPYEAGKGAFRKFSDTANAAVFQTLTAAGRTMKAQTMHYPNLLIVGARAPEYMVQADDVLGRVDRGQTSGSARGSLGQIAAGMGEVFMNDFRVVVMSGIDGVGSFLNSNDAWLGYVAPSSSLSSPTAIANIYWSAWVNGPDTTIDTYYNQDQMVEFTRGVYANDFKVIVPQSGIHIAGIV